MQARRVGVAFVTALILGLVVHPVPTVAASLGKAMSKATMARIFRRDLLRDARTPARALVKPRTVHRYTSAAQARRELAKGVAPKTHMTATARPGRPPSAAVAARRYGLGAAPQVRETIRLPAGVPLRHNRVLGGAPGWGELTSPAKLHPSTIRKVTPLPRDLIP